MSELISAWGPLLVIYILIIAFWIMARRSYQKHVNEVNAVNQAIIDTNKEMIVELREIKKILKDRH